MLFGRPPDHRCTFEAVQRNRPIRGTRSIGPGNYHLITIFSAIYILEQITVSMPNLGNLKSDAQFEVL